MSQRATLPATTTKITTPPIMWVGVILCLFLIFGDTQGCPLGKPPAYPVPADLPVAIAIAGQFSNPAVVEQMTKDYPGVIGTVQDWAKAKGGQCRLIDTDVTTKPEFEADWLKAAWDVVDKKNPPRIIGATPKTGIPDQPLPKTPDEVNKILAQLIP